MLFDEKGRQIQEWDGVLLSKDALYRYGAKHVMTVEKINAMAEKVNQFPKMIERYSQKEFDVKYSKIVELLVELYSPLTVARKRIG